jgi:hypothetical protein
LRSKVHIFFYFEKRSILRCSCEFRSRRIGSWSRLTCAAEPLPSHAREHVEAEVAVGRLVEVLQPPQVRAVIPHVLEKGKVCICIYTVRHKWSEFCVVRHFQMSYDMEGRDRINPVFCKIVWIVFYMFLLPVWTGTSVMNLETIVAEKRNSLMCIKLHPIMQGKNHKIVY